MLQRSSDYVATYRNVGAFLLRKVRFGELFLIRPF